MLPPLVTLLLLLIVAFVVSVALVVYLLADMLLRPPRMTDGKAMYVLKRMSPGDLGLPFETLEFHVLDRSKHAQPLKIVAWWVAAATPSSQTCVLIHGFADAKVGALAWANLWRDLGWNLLLVDLRAHGESGGRRSTGGFYERDDLDAVLNDLRARKSGETQRLALFGISVGGAVALATAARRDDINAVVADSVFADYRHAAIAHGALIRAPLPTLTPLAIRWAERLAGARFDEVRPVVTIPLCRCPVMFVQGDADPFVPPSEIDALADALSKRGETQDVRWLVAGAGHCLAIVADAQGYEDRLRAFLTSCDAASTRA